MCFATHTYTDMERCETCWKLETASTKLNLKVVEHFFFLLPSRLVLATNGRTFEELTCGPGRIGKEKNERMPASKTHL